MPPEHLGLSRHGFFHREAISRWKNAACTRSRPFRAARIEGELSLSIRPRPSPRAATRAANTAAPIAIAATPSRIEFFCRGARPLEMRQFVLGVDEGIRSAGPVEIAWQRRAARHKESNRCAQWWRMSSSRANTRLHARRHTPHGLHHHREN